MRAAQLIPIAFICAATSVTSAEAGSSGNVTDKGDFQYTNPPATQEATLDLEPLLEQVRARASVHCATPAAAASLPLGKNGGLIPSEKNGGGGAVVGKLVGGLLGTPGGRGRPKLAKDPIKKKHKARFNGPDGAFRISMGAKREGEYLVLSTRLDKAKQKGTFHAIFLERPDCMRFFPVQRETYGLWGSWSLSVNVTKTTSRYKNGSLIDRSVSRSNWQRSGSFDLSGWRNLLTSLRSAPQSLFNPAASYTQGLQQDLAVPLWQELGFNKPLQGPRTVGVYFDISPQEITPGTVAVVHITQKHKGEYHTVGLPLTLTPGAGDALGLTSLN